MSDHKPDVESLVDVLVDDVLRRSDAATASGVVHLPGVTNAAIRLHQEFWMRTGGYDRDALLVSKRRGPTTFHALVEELGLEEAIRDVQACGWLSETDWRNPKPGDQCRECQEAAHA